MPPQIPYDSGSNAPATPSPWTLRYSSAYENLQIALAGDEDAPYRPSTVRHHYGQFRWVPQLAITLCHLPMGHIPSSYPRHKFLLFFPLHQDIMIHGHPWIIKMIGRPPPNPVQVCTGDISLFFISWNKCTAGNGSYSGSTNNSPPWVLLNLSAVCHLSQPSSSSCLN